MARVENLGIGAEEKYLCAVSKAGDIWPIPSQDQGIGKEMEDYPRESGVEKLK